MCVFTINIWILPQGLYVSSLIKNNKETKKKTEENILMEVATGKDGDALKLLQFPKQIHW